MNSLQAATEKLKPGSKSTLVPLLEKARETVPQPEPKKGARGAGGAAKTAAVRGGARPAAGSAPAQERKTSKTNGRPAAAGSKSAAAAPSSRKKGEDMDTSPLYVASNLKNARFKDEAKLKLLKWNFAAPRQEFVDQLAEQMTNANFNKTLMAQMFHTDFKQHLKALESLSAVLADNDIEALIANLDLILKWMTLRFFETNPSVQIRGLEYLNVVFSMLTEDEYHLHDIEAVSFIPFLINKVGDPKDQIRNSIRSIFQILSNVYPASKFSGYLMEGIKSKNAKQRTECLDHLGFMVQNYGSHVLQPTVSACLKEIAKQIGDRDNSVRNAALNCIAEVYFQVRI